MRFEGAAAESRTAVEVDARVSDRGSRLEVRALESRSAGGERVDQRLQVLEGGRAFIAAGSAQPLQLRDGAVIREAMTGFEVVPRLAGDTVTLDIAPQREVAGTVAQGSVQVQRASTTVSARLGEWVELGALEETAARRRIWVRVDEVRP